MKNFKRYIGFAAIIALLFTSCSKDEQSGIVDTEKATLSFGAIVNDLVANRVAERQAEADLPECTDDTPVYVRIVLMQGDTEVVGTSGNAYRIDLVTGQIYTEDDPALELDPGMYTLEHLSVYNSDDEVIWIAPRAGSGMGEYVDNPLPLSIDLRAGVKKYVDVSVVCFDDRDVNEYGYMFFELDTNIALTYCFFANYCNADGRHFPASYRISIWSGTSSAGVLLYSNVQNSVGQYEDNGEYYATPLCFAVPDNANMDTPYLYYEITVLDWEDVYGDVEQTVLNGTITKRMITDNFGADDDTDYHHIKFGCGDDDGELDSDGDGVPDSRDNCPNTPMGVDVEEVGCPVTPPDCVQTDPEADCDNDGIKNKCDEDNPNWATFDCDGDGVLNNIDECNAPKLEGQVDLEGNGCWTTPNGGFTCTGTPMDFGSLGDCQFAYINGQEGFVTITGDNPLYLNVSGGGGADALGALTVRLDDNDDLEVSADLDGITNQIHAYEVIVTDNATFCETLSVDLRSNPSVITDTFEDVVALSGTVNYPLYVKLKVIICDSAE